MKKPHVDVYVYSNNTVFHDDTVEHSLQLPIEATPGKKRILVCLDDFGYEKHFEFVRRNFEAAIQSEIFKRFTIHDYFKDFKIDNLVCMFNLIRGDRPVYERRLLEEPKEKEKFVLDNIQELVRICNESEGVCHQFSHDPQEARVFEIIKTKPKKYHYHFIHDLSNGTVDKINNISNTFSIYPFSKITETKEKEYDFVFGLSAYDEYRKSILNTFIELRKTYSTVYYSYYVENKNHVDTRIPYTEYLDKVSRAKCTLCVPAYSVDTFSIHRLIECISLKCVPIIDVNSNTLVIDDSLHYILRKHDLIVQVELQKLKNCIENVSKNYDTIIKELLECEYVKTVLQDEQYHFNIIRNTFKQ